MASIYDFSAATIDGRLLSLSDFRGHVLLIVNTASKCGFTPQYAGLQALYEGLHGRGLDVLGFPCNQFGGQEPGEAEEIAGFCSRTYGVTFPMFAKVDVKGAHQHPLFAFLTARKRGILGTKRIKWNFTKFLVDRSGNVVARFGPSTRPEGIGKRIEALLCSGGTSKLRFDLT